MCMLRCVHAYNMAASYAVRRVVCGEVVCVHVALCACIQYGSVVCSETGRVW